MMLRISEGGEKARYKPEKIYLLGEKYSGLKPRGELQVYDELKKYHLERGTLFEDPQFVPGAVDLGVDLQDIKWRRPHEIVENPHFALSGKKKYDINQGELGDCWFLAALTDISQDEQLINFIVPSQQSCTEDYAGIFHFRFWHYGKWIDIVVDDRLPTKDGRLIFMQQLPNSNEFWAALMEKAYAKLHRSYKNIVGGLVSEALVEMTGGLNETYFNLSKASQKVDFFDIMYTSLRKESYMGCGIVLKKSVDERSDGLLAKHAYSITDVQEVTTGKNKYKLVRLRNPWGHHEWNGQFSDSSEIWTTIPDEDRNRLLTDKDDGEFWMEYSDYLNIFDYLDICHRNPNFFTKNDAAKWKTFMTHCSWVPGVNNGGAPKSAAFSMNPQFILKINGAHTTEDYRIIVAVMQKNRREQGLEALSIGFALYKMDTVSPNERLDSSVLKDEKRLFICNPEYEPQVTGHVDLPNGTYCLIPFTTDINEHCDFLLRVYMEIDFELGERDDNVTLIEDNKNQQLMSSNVESDGPTLSSTVKKLFAEQHKAQIGWRELKCILDVLVKKEKKEFSKEVCQSMVALADTNITGKLNLTEFMQLWESIGIWRGIFHSYDRDNSRGISASELKEALKKANIKVNNRILKILLLRYADEDGQMEMEEFLHCCIKLNHMIAIYQVKGIKEMTLSEWLLNTLYS